MTEVVIPETRKRKRVSKNKKKTWRKTDVKDVEEYLEDKRLQERTGGLVAEKSDAALFFVDTSKHSQISKPTSKRQKWGNKPLKCHAALEPDPNIKQARSHHNVRQKPRTRLNENVQERINKGILSVPEKHAASQRQAATTSRVERNKQKTILPVAHFDLWTENKPDEKVDSYYLRQTKKLPVKVPAHYTEKPYTRPAVEVPHPGASYNPTYDDHQDLLQKAVDVEHRKVREELKLKRALDDKFPKRADAPTTATWLMEMSAGLSTHPETNETEDATTGDHMDVSVNPPIRRENKKTRQDRRKLKERKATEKKMLKEKDDRKRNNSMFRLKAIKAEVHFKDQILKDRQRKKEIIRSKKKKVPTATLR